MAVVMKDISMTGVPANNGTATLSWTIEVGEPHNTIELEVWATNAEFAYASLNGKKVLYRKYTNVSSDISDSATLDLSDFKGKAIQVGYLLKIDGYYIGGNVPKTIAKPVYVCNNTAQNPELSITTPDPKAGDTNSASASVVLPYPTNYRNAWVKLMLEDATVVKDWTLLNGIVVYGDTAKFYNQNITFTVPDKTGDHSLYAVFAYTDSIYADTPPEDKLTMAGYASTPITIKPGQPVKNWNATADKTEVRPGDTITITATIDWEWQGQIQFKLKIEGFDGKVNTETQPITPTTSPATISATITTPNVPAGKYSLRVYLYSTY